MIRWLLALALILAARAVPADPSAPVATRTLRAGTILAAADLRPGPDAGDGSAVDALVGLRIASAVYAGSPVLVADVGPPLAIRRNETVRLVYRSGAIRLSAEGRALGEAVDGGRVQVMNTGSRVTVIGTARHGGVVEVGG
ncbi:MAG: flagellar basal body P-ring formation chaperone FlgA [Hasllibacter sp.]